MTPKRLQTMYIYIYHIHIHIWSAYHRLACENPPKLALPPFFICRWCTSEDSIDATGWVHLHIYRYKVNKKKTYRKKLRLNGGTAPVEVGSLSPFFTGFYTSQVVGLGISEPINSITWSLKSRGFWAQHKVTTLSCHGLPHPFTSRWMGSRHGCLGFCF